MTCSAIEGSEKRQVGESELARAGDHRPRPSWARLVS